MTDDAHCLSGGAVLSLNMTILDKQMTTKAISVSEFKAHCLEVIRQVERDGAAVDLVRRGRVVARLMPSASAAREVPAWQRLRGRGRLDALPEESVLEADDFDALRDTDK